MKALVLAAGLGRRMRPLSDRTHKTLLPVGGATVLEHIVDALVANDVTSIGVVTGYRADEIERFLVARYPRCLFEFVRNERFRETNNIYSMALAFQHLRIDDDLLLIEADVACGADVVARAVRSPHANVALVAPYRSGLDGTVVTVEGGVVTHVIPPHLQVGDFTFAGKYKTLNVYKFGRDFCETTFKRLVTYYANTIDANCYYELVLGMLIYMQQASIHAEVIAHERWAEIDDPTDLRVAEFAFSAERRREILERTKGGYWAFDVTDFCFIRNMYFPTPAVLHELANVLPRLLHNYGSAQPELDQKVAYLLLCDPAHVVALNGLSQIYPLLRSLFADRRALIPAPTFGEYARTFPNHTTYEDAPGFDEAAIERAARTADVVVFVNPNNPTGTTIGTERLAAFAAAHVNKTIIVDESFIDFSRERSMEQHVRERALPNVLVLKSLSKSLGVPGVRLGYAYGTGEGLLASIRAALPIWSMNAIAEHLLEVALKHRDSIAQSYARTIVDRERFAAALDALDAVEQVHASGANFLLVRLATPAADAESLVEHLLANHATYVKDVTAKLGGANAHLRLAVRLPSENDALCRALAEAMASRRTR